MLPVTSSANDAMAAMSKANLSFGDLDNMDRFNFPLMDNP